MQLGHIGIEVQDLFVMELFYRSVLGFGPRYRYRSRNTAGLRTVFLERDGLGLELLERPRDAAFRTGPTRFHLALEVADVDGECRRLAALPGLAAPAFPALPMLPMLPMLGAPRTTGDGLREAELKDPEGNTIELSVRVRPEPRPRVRAVIFDLDGTLIDSEPNYYLADRELMARYGITFTEADKRQYIGNSNLAMMRDLVRKHALPVTAEALTAEKNALYLRIAENNTRVFPQMRRFLDRLVERGIPVAVASGSAPQVISRLLAVVGLAEPFAHVVSADEVARGKPAPDVFLEAARRLGVDPEDCLVVEDACPGVEAALRALMRCIAVPTLADPSLPATFHMADLLFPEGMDGFDPDRAWAFVRGLLD